MNKNDVHFFDERNQPERNWRCRFGETEKRVRGRSEGDARSRFARQLGLGFSVYHKIEVSPVFDRFAAVQETMLEQEIGFEPQPVVAPNVFCPKSGETVPVGAQYSCSPSQKGGYYKIPCPACGKMLMSHEVKFRVPGSIRVRIPAHKPEKKEK